MDETKIKPNNWQALPQEEQHFYDNWLAATESQNVFHALSAYGQNYLVTMFGGVVLNQRTPSNHLIATIGGTLVSGLMGVDRLMLQSSFGGVVFAERTPINHVADMLGGVRAGKPNEFENLFTGGVIAGSKPVVKEADATLGGFVVGSESVMEYFTPYWEGGVVVDSVSIANHFHPKATCGIVEFVNFCGCVPAVDTGGGCVLGSHSWWAANQVGDGLQGYFPLGEQGSKDISLHENAIGFGELDVTDGIICETAEQFRAQRYYQTPYPKYWDGLTVTFWYRSVDSIFEQTLFSYDPSLRLGLSWMGEPILFVRWDNETENEVFGSAIPKNQWLHFALRYNPFEELALFIDGELTLRIEDTRGFFDVAVGAFVGNLQGGSYIMGDVQDFRIYAEAKTREWVSAERDSYCQQWVETVEAQPLSNFVYTESPVGGSTLGGSSVLTTGNIFVANPSGGVLASGNGSVFAIGSMYHFNGSTDFVDIGSPAALQIQNLRVSFWMKLDSLTSSDLFLGCTDPNWTKGWGFDSYNNNSGLSFWVNNYNSNEIIGSASLAVNRWYFVEGLYNGTEIKLFVDRFLVAQKNYSLPIDYSTTALELGRGRNNQYNLDGYLSDVKIYNGDTLVANYKCSEGLGSVAIDSVSGINGLIISSNLATFHERQQLPY